MGMLGVGGAAVAYAAGNAYSGLLLKRKSEEQTRLLKLSNPDLLNFVRAHGTENDIQERAHSQMIGVKGNITAISLVMIGEIAAAAGSFVLGYGVMDMIIGGLFTIGTVASGAKIVTETKKLVQWRKAVTSDRDVLKEKVEEVERESDDHIAPLQVLSSLMSRANKIGSADVDRNDAAKNSGTDRAALTESMKISEPARVEPPKAKPGEDQAQWNRAIAAVSSVSMTDDVTKANTDVLGENPSSTTHPRAKM
jgi:Co/Zn/Cd efflux system component